MNMVRGSTPDAAPAQDLLGDRASLAMRRPGPEDASVATAPTSLPEGEEPAAEAAPRRRRGQLLWAGLGLVALIGAGVAAFWDHVAGDAPTRQEATLPPDEPLSAGEFHLSDTEMRALRIDAVTVRSFRSERIAEGRIAVNDDRATPVFSPYGGRVVKVYASLGESVRAGDTLFEIETTDLAGAASDLLAAVDAAHKARATLDQARREEARQASLFSARAAAQRDVEQARTAAATAAEDLRTAEATLSATRDKLRVLGRSTEQVGRIEQTRKVDAVVPVTAPIGGTVTQRRVGPGQWLSAGGSDPVFTIADLATVWMVAAVREMDAPLIRMGLPVEVSVGALPDRVFPARITTVGTGLDPTTRRLTVRAEVQDPDHLLKPEMFATFRIAVGDSRESVAVPVSAVIYRGPETSVWVALDRNRFILRPITVGIRSGTMLEVTEGLNDGDRIVTGGALFIDRAANRD